MASCAICTRASDVLSSIPTAPIATSFQTSPLTLVTPPVHEPAKVVNLYSSVYQPPTELTSYGVPAIHSDYGLPTGAASAIKLPTKTIIQKPEDIVSSTFQEIGDSIVQTVGSTNQKFEFKYPSTKQYVQFYPSTIKTAPILSRLEYPQLTRPLVSTTGWNQPTFTLDYAKKVLPLSTGLLHGAPKTVIHKPISVGHLSDKHEYSSGFELSDGTKQSESGHLITTGDGWENVIAKRGHYEYISPEGLPIKVNWVADENGFRLE